ncbi:MAG: PqqD family peptide modification chaperone [Gammaproteobacteria bacterium]|nr:MAG: PqqD family peptide modification chaperone [Gammaproteobacteria bacterium]
MGESFLSPLWYRVAELRPRLRPHVTVHRHRYRGQPWYVLHDHGAGRVHRFTPAAYLLIGQFDGRRSVDEIWRAVAETHDRDAPSQDDVIDLLSRLHQQDLIQYEGSPDVAELLQRSDRHKRQLLKQNLLNPLSIRVPLWDPEHFLTRTLPFVRPLLGGFGLLLWLLVVGAGLVTAGMHWDALTLDIADRMLATRNLLISLVTYPLLKAVHELMHGYLTKRWGGEVREMGIMFLVFFPVPYVDASAAAAFRSKWRRAAVSAGGILVETFVAAVALMVWANAEQGLVSAFAYNLVLIGGISTVLVNGNPLLRFDGYYVLTDLLEIPNLANRANRYWGYLVQRYLFGARRLRRPPATRGERVWFLIYAPAAYLYRIFIMLGIAVFVATKYFVVGVLIALWSIFNAVLKPLFKQIRHVMTSPKLRKVRRRAEAWTFGGMALLAALLLALPLPLRTDAEGVVWLPDEAQVRAGTAGFVEQVLVPPGQVVREGTPLLRLSEPTLDARVRALEAKVREMRLRLFAAEAKDRVEAGIAEVELHQAEAERDREQQRREDLVVRAPVSGRFEPVAPEGDLPGRFVNEGDLLGYVLPAGAERVRVAVPQEDVVLVRQRLTGVGLKVVGYLEQAHASRLLAAVPSATWTLPSVALGQAGGGRLLVDPTDEQGTKALEPFFLFDVALPDALRDTPYGTRVLVRFDHGNEPIAWQAARRIRQLFLRWFDV